MPQQSPNPSPRQPLAQSQSSQQNTRIPAQLIASGARLSIPAGNQLSQHILTGATPLVQVTRIGNVTVGQPITTHVVGPKTQIQIPKLTVGKNEPGLHTLNIGQNDTPVTSGSHITHLLSGSSLVTPLGQHVSLGQAPQRVTIQTMGQSQNPVSTQPVALALTQASSTQAGIGHGQHVGIVSNQMASIICANKAPRLTSQPTQLLQAFSSQIPRAGVGSAKTIGGNIIRATSHASTAPQQTAMLSHFSTRGPVITPIRTATISNRPNSPAVPQPSGLSITVPSSQLTEHHKFRTLSAAPGMEINLQTSRSLHEARPVISGSTKTIQLSHHPHAGGQKIVMATTAMPAGNHASITVAITKPIASHIVASALLPSNVTTVASASIATTPTIPIAKVTPQRFTQITQQPAQPQQQQQQQHQQHELPNSSHAATTLYLPSCSVGSNVVGSSSATTLDAGKPEPRSVSQMIQYSFAGQYEPAQHYSNLSHFQIGTSAQGGQAIRPTVVTAQPAITVAPVTASLSLQAVGAMGPNQPARLNQVVVMDPNRQIQVRTNTTTNPVTGALQTVHIPIQQGPLQPPSPAHVPHSPSSGTPSASPRPSILRKRANDGYPVVSKKALPFTLESGSRTEQVGSPKQQVYIESQSREASQSSTDTASSHDGSTNSTPTTNEIKVKLEEEHLPSLLLRDGTSSVEASPRKKPRKQLLQASQELKDEIVNSSSSEEEEHVHHEESEIKEEIKEEIRDEHVDEEGVRWVAFRKRPDFTLMNHYSCTWKTKNNHFLRYTDVRAKDERRPTVNELSNQKQIQQKSSGWKLYHLAAQLDDLVALEGEVKEQMATIQTELAPDAQRAQYGSVVDDVVMIHELTQANIQRSQLIIDQIKEARQSMLNLLDHKKKIDEIVTKNRSRRPVKSKARM